VDEGEAEGRGSRETLIDSLERAFEEAKTSVYSAEIFGVARVKRMDKHTYMQRALGISWAAKMSDYKECGTVRRKEGMINDG